MSQSQGTNSINDVEKNLQNFKSFVKLLVVFSNLDSHFKIKLVHWNLLAINLLVSNMHVKDTITIFSQNISYVLIDNKVACLI